MEKITWNEDVLNRMLTTPSDKLIRDISEIDGDILVLGAGGKMGPDVCILAKEAARAAGIEKKVYAVSRFTNAEAAERLRRRGVEIIAADLLDPGVMDSLPECKNIIFMAGRKFSTLHNEYITWGTNTWLPVLAAGRFSGSRIVVFSSGNLYPKLPPASGGASEDVEAEPVGEYCMSCLGRERVFEYAARTMGTSVAVMRLSYAVDLRYGVLHDIAQAVLAERPLDLSAMPSFNCIWQRDAAEAAVRLLLHASPDVCVMNVTGPETAGVRETARRLGDLLGKPARFVGQEAATAYLNNAGKMFDLMGYPSVSLNTMIRWQAEWLLAGGGSLGKPTHFEERNGNY